MNITPLLFPLFVELAPAKKRIPPVIEQSVKEQKSQEISEELEKKYCDPGVLDTNVTRFPALPCGTNVPVSVMIAVAVVVRVARAPIVKAPPIVQEMLMANEPPAASVKLKCVIPAAMLALVPVLFVIDTVLVPAFQVVVDPAPLLKRTFPVPVIVTVLAPRLTIRVELAEFITHDRHTNACPFVVNVPCARLKPFFVPTPGAPVVKSSCSVYVPPGAARVSALPKLAPLDVNVCDPRPESDQIALVLVFTIPVANVMSP